MSDPAFRVGLLGWGNAGRFFHAPLIHAVPGLELATVVTSRSGVQEQYPGVRVAATMDSVLNDATIDLVVIATPHKLHAPHAQAALAAGKHVVVEKPLATSAAQAETLIAESHAANRLLVAYHNRRWDGDFMTVQKLVASGLLGDLYAYESHWPLYRPTLRGVWRENPDDLGGALYDLGPHMIDQVLVLFGKPQSVYAEIATHRAGCQVDDFFRLHLRFPSDLSAILIVDMMAPIAGPRFHLRGTLGSFEKRGLDPQEAALRAGRMPAGEDWGVEPPAAWGRLCMRDLAGLAFDGQIATVPGDYRQFYRGVYEALCGNGPPPVDPQDAALQLRIIEAALESARSGSVQPIA
jgi:predicted dehydrogenase